MANFSQDYIDDVLVRMAHHNSAIEGNTITLPETVSIILEGTTPSNHKSIREFFEIENHRQAFEYLFNCYDHSEELSIGMIKDFHSLLLDRLQHDKGSFKTADNAIQGADVETASPQETPILMKQWLDNTNYQIDYAESLLEALEIFAESHIKFERIHPFSDGNGRTGRLIILYQSLLELGTPIVINKDDRAKYIEALGNQDIRKLTNIFEDSINYEKKRIKNFRNMTIHRIDDDLER